MDFGQIFGMMAPQAEGVDPFALGNLLRTNPDAAAQALASTGAPPPAQGQSFGDWASGFAKSILPNPSPLFPGQPGTPPAPAPTGTPSQAGDVTDLFNRARIGTPPPATPLTTAPPAGLPGAGQSGTMQRSTVPDILAGLNPQPIPGEPVPLPPQRPMIPGAPLDITSEAQQAGAPQQSPVPPKAAASTASLQNALGALKAPANPEFIAPKAGTPPLPHPGALPKDQLSALLAALMGQRGGQAVRLSQALGGLRG